MIRATAVRTGLLVALLAGCDSSENIYWAFVSNPSGSGFTSGGAVIVIHHDGSTSSSLAIGSRALAVRGRDDDGAPVTVHLPVCADAAVVERGTALELRSPLLAERRVRLERARLSPVPDPAFALTLELTDTAAIDPRTAGPGRLHIARAGSLLVLEQPANLVAFGAAGAPDLPPGSRLDASGERPVVITPDGRAVVLHPPPLPAPEARLGTSSSARGVALLGPDGETLADLPREHVELHGGAGGLFMTASFPGGLGPRDPTPMQLSMAAHNRYLLRVELE